MKPYVASWLPLLLCLAACNSVPAPRTYLLTPALGPTARGPAAPGQAPSTATATATPTPTPTPSWSAERIVVRRVLLPDYLDTTDIVLRDGIHEVKPSATARWGERLSQGLTSALTADLVALLPPDAIVLGNSDAAQRQLLVTVNALDLWPDGRCELVATWSIVDQGVPHVVASGSGTFESPAAGSTLDVGDARLVASMARTVDQLADALARNIRQTH